MANTVVPIQYITVQPQTHHVIISDPFKHFQSEWSVGLCNCCDDMGQCCYAYFCWHCFLCSFAGRIGESSTTACCVPNALSVYRMKVRSILKIRGDACNDCCVVCWCPFCAGLQMQNELRYRGLA